MNVIGEQGYEDFVTLKYLDKLVNGDEKVLFNYTLFQFDWSI